MSICCGMCGDTKLQNGLPCPQCAAPPPALSAERLREALAGIMKLIDNGELVRDISHDHEGAYALRAINFVIKLKAAQEALDGTAALQSAPSAERLRASKSEEVYVALQKGIALVESAFAHASHSFPTRADAGIWLEEARKSLEEPTPAPQSSLRQRIEALPRYTEGDYMGVEKHPTGEWVYLDAVLAELTKEQE